MASREIDYLYNMEKSHKDRVTGNVTLWKTPARIRVTGNVTLPLRYSFLGLWVPGRQHGEHVKGQKVK